MQHSFLEISVAQDLQTGVHGHLKVDEGGSGWHVDFGLHQEGWKAAFQTPEPKSPQAAGGPAEHSELETCSQASVLHGWVWFGDKCGTR